MSSGTQRLAGIALVLAGLLGLASLVGTGANRRPYFPRGMMGGPALPPPAVPQACDVPTLPGATVEVSLTDMGMMGGGGGMVSGGRMMNIALGSSTTTAGTVSFLVRNSGWMTHELLVMPLPPGGAGTRAISSDGRVSESSVLAEASNSCGQGSGGGIASGSTSWVSVDLSPGRYELICNLPGHYAMGMHTELDVR